MEGRKEEGKYFSLFGCKKIEEKGREEFSLLYFFF
ncbi:hypothetical protein SLEP1_g48753 [Rubroshorea leprosula]|uniref:Uncharacterized protein n=1 Tax=Rubroshorea leprosula TaxID=152421 RepID=A0AAV5LXP1_9ROSI|nr:hypothetical protein SLEP1_g48753 [Rubroshorea leprosula]